jgi:transcriptional regulator with XRE-family HTH domain
MDKIIDELEQARLQAGLSTRELSARAGLTASHWWQIYNRTRSAHFKILERFASVLGYAIVIIPVPVTE